MHVGQDKKGLDRDSYFANHNPVYVSINNS
jgi:hypothetical protein